MFTRHATSTTRKLGLPLTLAATGVYVHDTYFNDQVLRRTGRTLFTVANIAFDYKFRFVSGKEAQVYSQMHQKTASRLLKLCQANGGLYIKLGQGMALQSAVMPPEFHQIFQVLFNEAPFITYDQVSRIIKEEFQVNEISQVFSEFELAPVAAASIAQVHKARLKTGEWVAVKVQKPEIRNQMEWDLRIYRLVLTAFEKLFKLPITWTLDYTEKHLRQEVDFLNEGRNAERTALDVERAGLAHSVYIPKVYWDKTTSRVLTCEWIDGFNLAQVASLNYSVPKVVGLTVDLFAYQIFHSGFVHCDPHPGNIIIRPHPQDPKRPQLVLLDHGLYIEESPEFRVQYAELWKSIFSQDLKTLRRIAEGWGIGNVDMFASATLLRPHQVSKESTPLHLDPKVSKQDIYAMQMQAKERAQEFLKNTELMPRELIFVGRNMNIVRAINKSLGSPVNRIQRMVKWAAWGVGSAPLDRKHVQLSFGMLNRWNWLKFNFSLLLLSLGFWMTNLRASLTKYYGILFRREVRLRGFEDVMDQRINQELERQYGIKVEESAFIA